MEAWVSEIPLVVWLAGFLALYMAWGIGANDVANAMGTSVGSGALTLGGAVLVAGVLEFSGAFLAGGHVTDTVRKGMLDMDKVALAPELLVYGMLAALSSAGTLLLLASWKGLPISTTHSIVGAIIGFGSVAFGIEAVAWGKVIQIVLSWITSPLLGGALAFGIFRLIRSLILNQEDPIASARTRGPYFFFVVFFVIGMVTLFKGLKNLNLDFDFATALLLSLGLGALGFAIGSVFVRRVAAQVAAGDDENRRTRGVERIFVVLQILTACAVAFAHGSNDVANSIGPLAAIVNADVGIDMVKQSAVAPWMLALGGIGIVFGLATWGYRVMETIGRKITELTPSRGFAAELAAAMTIILASRLGIPVSTTHILVGAVLGVGLARGIGALDLRVVGQVFVSWVATVPLAALFSIAFFYLLKALLAP